MATSIAVQVQERVAKLPVPRTVLTTRFGISYSTVQKFMQRENPNPRVRTIEQLLHALTVLEDEAASQREAAAAVS